MERILSVEDDEELARIIKLMLESRGYQVTTASSIALASSEMEKQSFDLILLDMMLPDGEGTDLCNNIRKESFCPIIFVSCLSDSASKIKALQIGGDDYVTKPIDFEELFVRIQANLRRANKYNIGKSVSAEERFPYLLIKKNQREVWITDETGTPTEMLVLSPTEYGLLICFVNRQEELLMYEDLYRSVWNANDFGDYRTVMVHVSNLRKKMKDYGIEYIHTVRGAGYIFRIK
jgi:DNA-binding response OmpR family regulator